MNRSSSTTGNTSGGDDRLAEWQRSPSVPVKKATGLKTRLLLSHLGRELQVMHRNEPCVIRPLSIFRKPAYNRMYVEAECEGETRIFNISDLMIRRPDSDSYYDDDEPAARRSLLPLLGVLIALAAIGAGVAIFLDVIPVDLQQLLGDRAAEPNAPAAPPASGANEVKPDTSPAVEPPNGTGTSSPVAPAEPTPMPPVVVETVPQSSASDDPTFGREFSDTTGGFRTRAEFVEFQPDRGRGSRVILRKADGTQLDVAMNSLSKDDQTWVRDEVKRRKMP